MSPSRPSGTWGTGARGATWRSNTCSPCSCRPLLEVRAAALAVRWAREPFVVDRPSAVHAAEKEETRAARLDRVDVLRSSANGRNRVDKPLAAVERTTLTLRPA